MSRGIRNNNPLNIERSKSRPWIGEIRPSQDPRFAQFETIEHGYRAAFKLLHNYKRLHGCVYLEDFINRWAPPVENDTKSYISFVARRSGVPLDEPLDTRDQRSMTRLVAAMSKMETGVEPVFKQVEDGWRLYRGLA